MKININGYEVEIKARKVRNYDEHKRFNEKDTMIFLNGLAIDFWRLAEYMANDEKRATARDYAPYVERNAKDIHDVLGAMGLYNE